MNTNMKSMLSRTLVFALAIMASATCSAWHGGGGYHGGGYHGGGYHGGGYYGGGYHGGGWGGGGWGWGLGAAAIGIPLGYYGASYYAPACYNQRVCRYNGYRNVCWTETRC